MSEQARARRNRWLVVGLVAAIIVISVTAILVAWQYAPEDDVRVLTDQGNQHVNAPVPDYVYITLPPASGPHVAERVAWGEHTETIPNWRQLHNLEVGGVIMHYDCPDGCPATLAALRAILEEHGTEGLVLHPYPDMDHRVVLTAWARMLALDEVDRAAITDFIKTYRDPELAP